MRFRQRLRQVLVWSYERGTWQYDIMCALILAFIFFTPQKLFNMDRIDKKILAYGGVTVITDEAKPAENVDRNKDADREKQN